MQAPVKWGLVLGGAVTVEHLVAAVAGWHRTPEMAFVFLAIAIVLNAATVVLCLRETAPTSGWAAQVRNGVVVGLVGSVIIFAGAWFVTGVLFPDYFQEMAAGYRDAYVRMGWTEERIRETVSGLAATSPTRSAFEGVVGTMVVSVMVAALAGVRIRKKG